MQTEIQEVLGDLIIDMVAERQLPHRNASLCAALSDAIAAMRRLRDVVEAAECGMWEEPAVVSYPLAGGLFQQAKNLLGRKAS